MTNVSMFLDPLTGLPRSRDMGTDNEVLNVATLEFIDGSLPEDMEVALASFNNQTMITPGLWLRYPGASNNSVDNYIALTYLSVAYARAIWHYGEAHGWEFPFPELKWNWAHWTDYFKNLGRFFFGRFLGFRVFVKARWFEKMSFWDAVIYGCSAIITSLSPPANTSDKCLQVLMNDKVRGLHWLSDLGIAVFETVMSSEYPAKLRSLYGVYFGVSHPFTLNVRTDRW